MPYEREMERLILSYGNTAKTNEELVAEYQAGNHEAIASLYAKNWRFVRRTAFRYSWIMERDRSILSCDLEQACFMGMMRAAQQFEPERGTKFLSMAARHMTNAMLYWANMRSTRARPEHNSVQMSKPVHEEDPDGETFLDNLADTDSESADDIATRSEECAAVRAAVDRMKNKQEQRLIREYYLNGRSLEEAGRRCGLNPGYDTISCHRKAMRALQMDWRLKQATEYYREKIIDELTPFYRHVGPASYSVDFSSSVERNVFRRDELRERSRKKAQKSADELESLFRWVDGIKRTIHHAHTKVKLPEEADRRIHAIQPPKIV